MARGLGQIKESVPHPRPCGAGPRASRRIGTSFEASWYGSGPSLLRLCLDVVRGGPGLGCGGFACGCILVSLFIRSKQFFRFLLRVVLFMVSDSTIHVVLIVFFPVTTHGHIC